ncbi:hypothetical protein FNF31_06465 [Cafeteria roenbergensis]|nr:hypothetical protein FNF31_06465 [Cafeteria roenbergensis]
MRKAVLCDRIETVRVLLEHGADLEARDRAGETLLMRASRLHRPDVARLLLDAGADVDAKDRVGRDAVICALMAGRPEVLRVLLERGASTVEVNYFGGDSSGSLSRSKCLSVLQNAERIQRWYRRLCMCGAPSS